MLAQVCEFSFVLEKVGRGAGLYPAGLAGSGSQSFIAATVTLLVVSPFLLQAGERLGGRAAKARTSSASATMLAEVEEQPVPAEFAALENHVIVAGYGAAARKLVRVLASSGVPFVITTLSPAGANEAERDGMPVMRGDSSRLRTLQHVGIEKAKMLVIADDDPAQAGRIAMVARSANPTMRIVVRTRYMSEAEPLTRAGSDRVITEELESIVQTFADVLSTYRIPSDQILAYEEAIRAGNYRALEDRREAARLDPCTFGEDCFDTRIVTVRTGGAAANRALGELDLERRFGIGVRGIHREGADVGEPSPDFVLQPGDELRLAGSAAAFARSAEIFRGATDATGDDGAAATALAPATGFDIDLEQTIELSPRDGGPTCPHLAEARPVHPSANGCEECLRIGDRWVHLRICMTCGHVGCCDSSPNRHATKHFHATTHPIMRSMEPGEEWAWCYEDRLTL
jgi:CPA2 family monovalent cation:H+ antiporter-2